MGTSLQACHSCDHPYLSALHAQFPAAAKQAGTDGIDSNPKSCGLGRRLIGLWFRIRNSAIFDSLLRYRGRDGAAAAQVAPGCNRIRQRSFRFELHLSASRHTACTVDAD